MIPMPFLINTILIVLLVSVAVLIAFLIQLYPGKRCKSSKEKIPNVFYAHRGLWDIDIPENSMSAFANAVNKSFGIELDLQLTKDGEVVVFHDDDVKRMCGVDKKICDMLLSEVQELQLLGTEEKIPLLTQVLALVDGKVPLIIELKCRTFDVQPLCNATATILDNYKGIFCIESFNPFAISWFRKYRPAIIRGQLADAFLHRRETRSFMYFILHNMLLNIATEPDFIAYNTKNKNALAFRLVKLFHPTLVGWTIRSQEELNQNKNVFDRFIFEGFIPDTNKS